MAQQHRGRCLCGRVAITGLGAPTVAACHCTMCRRWHGGPSISVRFAGGIEIVEGEESVSWYRSSDWAERGFCTRCGSTLFYRLVEATGDPSADLMGESGSFELPTGLEITEHYFIDEKPDFYRFAGDAPCLTGAEVFARFGEPE